MNKWLFPHKCDFYARKFKSCGKNLLVYGKPMITESSSIVLGNHVNLNDGCMINATNSSIVIGDYVTISSGAKVLAASYNVRCFLFEGSRVHQMGEAVRKHNVS